MGIDKATGLTPKQKMFCDCYIINKGNGTQAAKDAGYKARSDKAFSNIASENLGKLGVQKYLQEHEAEAAASLKVGKDEAIEILSRYARGEPDKGDVEGVPYVVRVKSAELLLKMYGAFTEKIELRASVDYGALLDAAKENVERGDRS